MREYIYRISIFVSCLSLFVFSSFFSAFSHAEEYSWTYLSPAFHNYSEAVFDVHLSVGGHYKTPGDFNDVVIMIKELKRYTFDISWDMFSYDDILPENAKSPTKIMQESRDLQSIITTKMDRLKAKEVACWNKKKLNDTRFYSALEDLSAVHMETAVDSAIEHELCATDARIKFNAYDALNEKLLYYHNLFSRKYEYWLSLGNH